MTNESIETLKVSGSVVKPLTLSLSRREYEQLLETIENLFKVPADLVRPPTSVSTANLTLYAQTPDEEDLPDQPFELDRKFKRRLFSTSTANEKFTFVEPKVTFDLPKFAIQLKNELNEPLIEILFHDFNVNYEKNNVYETNLQISLRSLSMEDLLQPVDSKHRCMLVSSSPEAQVHRPGSAYSSRSCPNLIGLHFLDDGMASSLPENLSSRAGFVNATANHAQSHFHQYMAAQHKSLCPETPPPSPQRRTRQDNLVLYSALIVDSNAPNFDTQYNSMHQTSSIDFNSLDFVVSVKSWFAFLDFFGIISDGNDDESTARESSDQSTQTIDAQMPPNDKSELEISVRSLTLVFVRSDTEIAKANVSNAHFVVSKYDDAKTVKGRLGSVSLFDLTAHGALYRERFITSGNEALNFVYTRDGPKNASDRSLKAEALVKIKMASVRYVHTKRFVAEIQWFVNEFQQLQTPLLFRKLKHSESRHNLHNNRPMQLALQIKAGSPIIMLPQSSKSNQVIVADLGEFSLHNSFHLSSETELVISQRKDIAGVIETLDVMQVNLVNTDLFAGERYFKNEYNPAHMDTLTNDPLCMDMGSYIVCKQGANLLNDKCQLKLIVERNLSGGCSHNVPDFSIHGTLSRLETVLNSQQYKLVRGFLTYNLGEALDDLDEAASARDIMDSRYSLFTDTATKGDNGESSVWTSMSITLDLQGVSVRLQVPAKYDVTAETSLACINFIKSSLKIDIFSDQSQDIDLVSQEILVTDSRFDAASDTIGGALGGKASASFTDNQTTKNVFTNVLQPINFTAGSDSVQAEVHTRKRDDSSKYTILLNNMRVMAILDWMESVRDFLSQDCSECPEMIVVQKSTSTTNTATSAIVTNHEMEVILNITNSELVFVEKTDQWDTNAIILKSTTVLSFRPAVIEKVMSINLNHLEVFSCLLGFEEDTALSIIDPITINMDLKQNVLDVHMQKRLCIRLSYNDMKMFMQMLASLPNQTKTAQNRDNNTSNEALVNKLSALGFAPNDCVKALDVCHNVLDDSALWLTQNAEPTRGNTALSLQQRGALDIRAVEIRANCISICVIDDCKDADVPLLEVSFSELEARQEFSAFGDHQQLTITALNTQPGASNGFKAGYVKGIFASDYYNRALSGWEPIIEPWKCEATWNHSFGHSIQSNRLQLKISSDELLKANVTTTLIELFNLVHENWTQDYYSAQPVKTTVTSPGMSVRRRNPFVPFALKNETGSKLWFTTLVAGGNESSDLPNQHQRNDAQHWKFVDPGAVVTFSFGPPHKQRHYDSHKLNLHQIGVRIEGWSEVGPVSVDRVGIFFRYAHHELAEFVSLPKARIVFSVSLEGSAQKLVTVRSALRFMNKLGRTMLLKMEHLNTVNYPQPQSMIIQPNETYCIPLSHVNSHLYVVPVSTQVSFSPQPTTTSETRLRTVPAERFNGNEFWRKLETTDAKMHFCERSIHWRDMDDTMDVQQWYRTCRINRDKLFRLVVAIRRDGYPVKDFGTIPGHTITMLPPLRLHNLLPCDLLYRIPNETQGRVSASETANVYEINLESQIEIILTLDSYPGSEKIVIPVGHSGCVDYRLKLMDDRKRPLIVRASIQMIKGSALQITVSAAYWLVNRTGLPLVFRQEGTSTESSGQFDENEEARLVSPLMFSFIDPDGTPSLTVRLGKRYGANPPWCQSFSLHKDVSHLQLRSGCSSETFIIGTEIRCGRGRYAKTKVVTFSPRFQLYNRSTYRLQFAQKCYATTLVSRTLLKTILYTLIE